MSVSDYFVADIVVRRNREKQIELLVMLTRKVGATEWLVKFPGGKSELKDRSRRQTLGRELWEETGLRLRQTSLVWWSRGYKYRPGDSHTKYFGIIRSRDLRGVLRSALIRDGHTDLGVPYWASLNELKGFIPGRSGLCDSHSKFLPEIEEKIAKMAV